MLWRFELLFQQHSHGGCTGLRIAPQCSHFPGEFFLRLLQHCQWHCRLVWIPFLIDIQHFVWNTQLDSVLDSYEEQEFWMTRLDWVGIRLNQFEMCETHENCLSRWKQCCSSWKQSWMKLCINRESKSLELTI